MPNQSVVNQYSPPRWLGIRTTKQVSDLVGKMSKMEQLPRTRGEKPLCQGCFLGERAGAPWHGYAVTQTIRGLPDISGCSIGIDVAGYKCF